MGAKKKPAVVTVVKPDDLPSRQPKRRTRSYKDHDGGQMEWNDVNEFKTIVREIYTKPDGSIICDRMSGVVIDFLAFGQMTWPYRKPIHAPVGTEFHFDHTSDDIHQFDWRKMVAVLPEWFRRFIDEHGGISRLTLSLLRNSEDVHYQSMLGTHHQQRLREWTITDSGHPELWFFMGLSDETMFRFKTN